MRLRIAEEVPFTPLERDSVPWMGGANVASARAALGWWGDVSRQEVMGLYK